MATPGTSVLHGTVTVDTTTSGGEVIVAGRSGRRSLALANTDGSDTVWIGGTGEAGTNLTIANGFPLGPGQTITFTDFIGAVYGIVDTGDSADVRYLEA